jgi:hypothetical protein
MNKILDSICSARWIVVVLLTIVFGYCTLTKTEVDGTFMTIYGMAIAWYFGKDRSENKTPEAKQ